jgi:hypothetical protein
MADLLGARRTIPHLSVHVSLLSHPLIIGRRGRFNSALFDVLPYPKSGSALPVRKADGNNDQEHHDQEHARANPVLVFLIPPRPEGEEWQLINLSKSNVFIANGTTSRHLVVLVRHSHIATIGW